jgi:hypothetical protein
VSILREIISVIAGIDLVTPGVIFHFIEPVEEGRRRHPRRKKDLENPKNSKSIERRCYRREEIRHITRFPWGRLVSLGFEDGPLIKMSFVGPSIR